MFDLFAMLLCSIASFLFPIFASYKALNSSDPAQLTPWLMYWVVFSCCLLVESWVSFILVWVPFYGYFRLFFLLYLVLPQTQGARVLYEQHVHPFLQENEHHIDGFIASAHDRLKTAGLTYFRQAIEFVRQNILNLPPREREEPPMPPAASAAPQTYTQALLARFSVPTRVANSGSDFYGLLANAVAAATSVGRSTNPDMTASGTLIPADLKDSGEKMSFIAAQRERLNIVLQALDREAQELQRSGSGNRAASVNMDGDAGHVLTTSRSEADFEKIDAPSGTEEDSAVRRRNVASGSWLPFGMGQGASSAQEE